MAVSTSGLALPVLHVDLGASFAAPPVRRVRNTTEGFGAAGQSRPSCEAVAVFFPFFEAMAPMTPKERAAASACLLARLLVLAAGVLGFGALVDPDALLACIVLVGGPPSLRLAVCARRFRSIFAHPAGAAEGAAGTPWAQAQRLGVLAPGPPAFRLLAAALSALHRRSGTEEAFEAAGPVAQLGQGTKLAFEPAYIPAFVASLASEGPGEEARLAHAPCVEHTDRKVRLAPSLARIAPPPLRLRQVGAVEAQRVRDMFRMAFDAVEVCRPKLRAAAEAEDALGYAREAWAAELVTMEEVCASLAEFPAREPQLGLLVAVQAGGGLVVGLVHRLQVTPASPPADPGERVQYVVRVWSGPPPCALDPQPLLLTRSDLLRAPQLGAPRAQGWEGLSRVRLSSADGGGAD